MQILVTEIERKMEKICIFEGDGMIMGAKTRPKCTMKRRILFGKTDEASGEVLYIGMLCRVNGR